MDEGQKSRPEKSMQSLRGALSVARQQSVNPAVYPRCHYQTENSGFIPSFVTLRRPAGEGGFVSSIREFDDEFVSEAVSYTHL